MPYCVLSNLHSDQTRGKPAVALAWALLAVALLISWQFLTIHYNRQGNWTALFCTGGTAQTPPQLAGATFRFANSAGYDGQLYRYVAHDPLGRLGFKEYIDGPAIRYRRILIPALAFALAGGRQESIDQSYIAVVALFVLAGSYWLSRWAASQGLDPAWGLTFLLAPATLISMDRMTVDVALAALTIGLAWYATIRSTAGLYCVLVLACLARETGALLLAATCACEMWSGRFARALVYATACFPMLLWYLFVSTLQVAGTGAGVPRWLAPKFGWGIFGRILDPLQYPLPTALETLTRWLDVIALLGIVCAIAAAIILLSVRSPDPLIITAALFAVAAIFLTRLRYWNDCFGYSRVFTPLLLATVLSAVKYRDENRRWWWMVFPVVLVDLRIGLQLGPQALGILQGIAGR